MNMNTKNALPAYVFEVVITIQHEEKREQEKNNRQEIWM